MEFVFSFLIFLFGLIIGSFLNVVIYRLETGETVVSGRSHCRDCGHVLEWYDLMPVLSFFALGGKCRYCRKKISWQYPAVEIATGILFVAIFSIFGGSAVGGNFTSQSLLFIFYFLFIISSLIVIFVYDLRHYIIPDKVVYSAIIVSIIYLLFFGIFCFGNCLASPDLAQRENLLARHSFSDGGGFGNLITLFNPFIAAILAGAFFLAIVLLTKGRGMGGGDVKLAFLMGLVLGWPNILPALFLAFAVGAIYGIILIIMKRKTFKSEVPFGPFLVMGTVAAIFWGGEMMKGYLGYLF